MTNPCKMTSALEREIEEAANDYAENFSRIDSIESELRIEGFHAGAIFMLEHMKQKEMEKLADETLDDRYAKLHTKNELRGCRNVCLS